MQPFADVQQRFTRRFSPLGASPRNIRWSDARASPTIEPIPAFDEQNNGPLRIAKWKAPRPRSWRRVDGNVEIFTRATVVPWPRVLSQLHVSWLSTTCGKRALPTYGTHIASIQAHFARGAIVRTGFGSDQLEFERTEQLKTRLVQQGHPEDLSAGEVTMHIAVASGHGGFSLKGQVLEYVRALGYSVACPGTYDTSPSTIRTLPRRLPRRFARSALSDPYPFAGAA